MQINPGAAEFPHRQIAAQLKAQVRRGDVAKPYGQHAQEHRRRNVGARVEELSILQ